MSLTGVWDGRNGVRKYHKCANANPQAERQSDAVWCEALAFEVGRRAEVVRAYIGGTQRR